MNITDPIRARANAGASGPAIIAGDATIGYRHFERMLDRIAGHALAEGLGPGQVVALARTTPVASVVLPLALARIGVATRMATKRVIGRADAVLVRRGDEVRSPVRTVAYDDDWFAVPRTATSQPVASHQDPDAVCRIFPTSGTTGEQKSVAVTHAMMAARVRAKDAAEPLPLGTRLLVTMGPAGPYGFRDTLRTLWAGGTVVLLRSLEELAARLELDRVTWLVAPPATLISLVEARTRGAGPIASLGTVEVGGSAMSPALYQTVRERVCPNVVVSFGATESGTVACAPMEDVLGRPGAVGRVLPGFEVRIVDDDGRELPRGADGTLAIRGAACAMSYVDDDEGSRRVFRDGWFHPGDIARFDDDGVLVIRGRHDERINVGGSKATPEVIESFVLSILGVVDAAAFAYSSAQGLDRVGLAIVADATFDFDAFRSQCEARLGVFTPQTVLRLREIPRNANGKVERRALADMLPPGATGGARTILGR